MGDRWRQSLVKDVVSVVVTVVIVNTVKPLPLNHHTFFCFFAHDKIDLLVKLDLHYTASLPLISQPRMQGPLLREPQMSVRMREDALQKDLL